MGRTADRPNDATIDRLDGARRVNAACDRFEAAWSSGAAPRIEAFQGAVEAGEWPHLLRELLIMELELRRGRGELPGPEEYRIRFPDEVAPVEAAFAALTGASGGPHAGRVLETLARTVGTVPRVLLRDTETPDNSAPVTQPSSTEMPPSNDRTCRLQLYGEIARGGMGAVLKGRDADLGRELAVKVLLDAHSGNPELVRRFVEEAQISGQLQHPGVVPIYELGAFADSRPYFSMKLVKGRTLAELLQERADPTTDLARFLSVFEAITQTMAYAHSRGVIHRDLKPSNVMVGSFGEVQVMDWGLAKVLPQAGAADAAADEDEGRDPVIATSRRAGDSDLSQAGAIMGTPAYMAPEQARGEADRLDERTDVFALGAILCELLTGHPAFLGRRSIEIQRKAAQADLDDAFARLDASGAGAELVALAKGCLAARTSHRPRHAGAVATRVGAYLAGVQERLRAAELAEAEAGARAEEERKRRRLTVALAASVLFTVAVGGGGWAFLAKQRTIRRAATAGVVNQALDRANLLQGKARADASDELARWTEAIAAADNAEAVLAAGESDPALRRRVAALRRGLARDLSEAKARAERAERDRRLLARLDEVHADREPYYGEAGGAREESDSSADAAYTAAFHESGFDPIAAAPVEMGKWLSTRPQDVVAAVTVALDAWASIRRHLTTPDAESSARRLLATARAADPDPWRNQLRDAIVRNDREAYRRLASDPALTAQPPSSLWLLGKSLGDLGEQALAASTLRKAQGRYPGDFWLNYELGLTLAGYYLPEKGFARTVMDADAVRFLTAALALRPRSASALIELGYNIAIHSPPQRDVGVALCREGVRLRPDYPNAHTHLAAALQRQLKFDESIAEWREAVRLKPDWAGARVALGNALVEVGRRAEAAPVYEEASRLLRESVRLHPDDVASHNQLGTFLWCQGYVSEAVAEFRQAVRLKPGDALTRAAFANRLRQMKRWVDADTASREAIQLLRDSTRRDPGNPDLHSTLGSLLLECGEPGEAVVELQEALRVGPDREEFRSILSNALIQKEKEDEVLNEYHAAIRARPDNVDARIKAGRAFWEKGLFEASIKVLKELVRLRPEVPDGYVTLAAALIRKGDLSGCLIELQKARQLQPFIPLDPTRLSLDLENLGWLLNGLGQYGEAVTASRASIELKPDYPNAHDNLGTALMGQGRFQEAIPSYREALKLQPRYPRARLNLVACLSKLGKSDEALAECREAIRLEPDDFNTHFQLGLLLDSKGNWERALTALRQAKAAAGPRTPSAARIEQAIGIVERKVALATRLPAVLRDVEPPADATERLEFAQMAYDTGRYAASARLFGEALLDQPSLADDRQAQRRYNAASAAALAGCGKGSDDPPPDDAERARLRRQALGWLKAEIAAWSAYLDDVGSQSLTMAVEALTGWTRDPDLDGVRTPEALETLADPERTDWQALWAKVGLLLKGSQTDSR